MKEYNILIFPCGTEIANEIINALINHKYFKVLLASSEGNSYCNFRNQKIDTLPFVTDDTFKDKLDSLIKIRDIDFIIPAHDDVAFILSKIENDILALVIGQSKNINDIVRFKDITYEYFDGILPLAHMYKNLPRIEKFPLFTKPKKGQGSQNSIRLNNEEEYSSFFSTNIRKDFVLMECLTGEEFTIDCFSNNGDILYSGARTREKTTRGISVQSTLIRDHKLNTQFSKYAKIISESLNMNGVWFYQMKLDKNNVLKLLEVGPRVSGTMMLNRARGINFVELALYQKLGYNVEVVYNDIDISLARSLVPVYKHNINYTSLYIDFDDTLLIDEKYINPNLMSLIFQVKNENKTVTLITKNKKNNLTKILHKFGITNLFDDIIHITDKDKKINFMVENSLLIDDSFNERKEVIQRGMYAYGIDNIDVLIKKGSQCKK